MVNVCVLARVPRTDLEPIVLQMLDTCWSCQKSARKIEASPSNPWLSLSMDIHKERLGGVLESGAPT